MFVSCLVHCSCFFFVFWSWHSKHQFCWNQDATLPVNVSSTVNVKWWFCFILRRKTPHLVAKRCNTEHKYICELSTFHLSRKIVDKFLVKHLVTNHREAMLGQGLKPWFSKCLLFGTLSQSDHEANTMIQSVQSCFLDTEKISSYFLLLIVCMNI